MRMCSNGRFAPARGSAICTGPSSLVRSKGQLEGGGSWDAEGSVGS